MNATRANSSQPFPAGAAASVTYDAAGCRQVTSSGPIVKGGHLC